MPTTTVFVAPELFFEHNGVKIYNTYKYDDIMQGSYTWDFTLDPTSDSDEWKFDVRSLDVSSKDALNPNIPYMSDSCQQWRDASLERRQEIVQLWGDWQMTGRDNAIRQVLTEAIDQGNLRNPVPKDSGQES